MTAMLVQVREILPSYRSGALPKVFKVLPKFEAWEEVHSALFYRAMHFSAKRGIAIACRPSVRLSECNVQVP